MKAILVIKNNKLLFLVALIYAVIFIILPDKGIKSVGNSVYYLIEMLQVLPVIFLLTVVIEALIPKELIMRGFGENSGFKGNLLALLLGSISAGPVYAAFPIGKSLLGKGSSISNIVIILSSWAVIKVPMLANEAKFLGVHGSQMGSYRHRHICYGIYRRSLCEKEGYAHRGKQAGNA